MKEVVIDTETNALEGYDKCHVAVCRDLRSDRVEVFRNVHEDSKPLQEFLSSCEVLVGHNLVGFDYNVLSWLNVTIPHSVRYVDTLVVSRLLNYNQEGGHSLEAWGKYFSYPKDTFSDFSKWSQELEDRCIVDTELTKKLYLYFEKYIKSPDWQRSIQLEHDSAFLCNDLKSNGFSFNHTSAVSLLEDLSKKVKELEDELQTAFPPKPVLIREISPKTTIQGTLHSKDFRWLSSKDLTPFSSGAPFSLIEMVPFNPRSSKQRVEVLNAAGWKPFEKTDKHIEAERNGDKEKLKHFAVYGWKTSEDNLLTLPDTAPEAAKKLADFLLLSSRLSSLVEWNALYDASTGRIHGTFNTIGSWTHRKSHTKPNMANIPALTNRHGQTQPYGKEFRSLWCAPEGRVLVGCDAEGIQLRLFAHYCNDKKLIQSIVSGKKEEGTDIHSLNMQVLNTTYNSRELCRSREVSKTYIYAVLLGAAAGKQAEILSCNFSEAKEGFNNLLRYYPGWKELKDSRLAYDAKKGYFTGLDNRKVMFPSAHHILAGYLQNGESVVMKMAARLWNSRLKEEKVPFVFVNDVHDEWQTETLPEYADYIGSVQADAIRIVGEELGLNCALAGKYVIGNNWAETH